MSAVVNLHDEGDDAKPSLSSVSAAAADARAAGWRVEVIVVCDRADEATIRVAESAEAEVLRVDVGDLGRARNAGVSHARGRWVAFLDGDDLWSPNWLAAAAARAAQAEDEPESVPTVWHPAMSAYFGETTRVVHHPDSADPAFDRTRFRLHNAWTALCFCPSWILGDVPYRPNHLSEGFGFEDWSWNTEILDRGWRHGIVPDTVHAIRRAGGESLISKSVRSLRTPWRQAVEQ